LSWASERVRSWATGNTTGRGQKRGVQREEGRGNARKEWKVRKKECNKLKEIKNERCSEEKVREGRKNLTAEEFETEKIKKARREGGEKKGERM
jgi:hypothetical protein